jgi:hypothetical protein
VPAVAHFVDDDERTIGQGRKRKNLLFVNKKEAKKL